MSDPRKRWVLAATILGSSIAFIDGSVVTIGMPAIRTDLQASAAAIQWIVNAYTLCLASLILLGGAAGDRFGRRRLFIGGASIFAVASLLCSVAPSIAPFIAARALQGIGAAMLIPNSLAIIGATFGDSERGRAIGTWAGVAALSTAAGPVIGGWLIDHASWRIVFAMSPAVAVPAILIALRHVRESRDPDASGPLDLWGALFAITALGALVFGLIALPTQGIRSTIVAGPLAASLVLLLVFFWHEHRVGAPMMPLAVFRSRTFSGVNALTLLLYGALSGAIFLLPFSLINVNGHSATVTGAMFLPFTILIGSLSRWFGGLSDRFGARLPVIVGPSITALGYGLLAWAPFGDGLWAAFVAPMSVAGLGMAISVAPLTTVVLASVPREHSGVASGINNAVSQVANLMAVAVFGAIALTDFNKDTLAHGIRMALMLGASLALFGALVSALTISSKPAAEKR